MINSFCSPDRAEAHGAECPMILHLRLPLSLSLSSYLVSYIMDYSICILMKQLSRPTGRGKKLPGINSILALAQQCAVKHREIIKELIFWMLQQIMVVEHVTIFFWILESECNNSVSFFCIFKVLILEIIKQYCPSFCCRYDHGSFGEFLLIERFEQPVFCRLFAPYTNLPFFKYMI